MRSHISEDQRKAILLMKANGLSSQQIAEELNLPHRTVMHWYNASSDVKTADTGLYGIRLYCLQELSRLLCWTAPKLAKCLENYIPALINGDIDINPGQIIESKKSKPRLRAKTRKRGDAIVTVRTVQRYLAACRSNINVNKVWSDGDFAAHAVRIVWWQHDKDIRIKMVGDKSIQKAGWLLMLAERKMNNNTLAGDISLKIKFRLYQEHKFNTADTVDVLSTAYRQFFHNMTTLHLVTDSQKNPTAVKSVDALRSRMPKIKIIADKPTTVIGTIEIPASFPNAASVESYLAIILANCKGTPKLQDRSWDDVHNWITDEKFVANKLNGNWPFLSRDMPDTQ